MIAIIVATETIQFLLPDHWQLLKAWLLWTHSTCWVGMLQCSPLLLLVKQIWAHSTVWYHTLYQYWHSQKSILIMAKMISTRRSYIDDSGHKVSTSTPLLSTPHMKWSRRVPQSCIVHKTVDFSLLYMLLSATEVTGKLDHNDWLKSHDCQTCQNMSLSHFLKNPPHKSVRDAWFMGSTNLRVGTWEIWRKIKMIAYTTKSNFHNGDNGIPNESSY